MRWMRTGSIEKTRISFSRERENSKATRWPVFVLCVLCCLLQNACWLHQLLLARSTHYILTPPLYVSRESTESCCFVLLLLRNITRLLDDECLHEDMATMHVVIDCFVQQAEPLLSTAIVQQQRDKDSHSNPQLFSSCHDQEFKWWWENLHRKLP